MLKSASRAIMSCAGILVAVMSFGCTKPEENGMSDTVALAAPPFLVGPPGANPANTKYYVENTIKFGGKGHADSAYTGPFPCPGCAKAEVNLTVVPEARNYTVDWNYAFRNSKRRGWIVAKIYNADTVDYLPLELTKGDSAYLWVGPVDSTGSDRAVAYYKIDNTGHATGPMMPYRKVLYCDNPKWENRRHAAAKGKHEGDGPCYEVSYPGGTASTTTKASISPVSLTRAMQGRGGAWLSCMYGCCEIGAVTAVIDPVALASR